MRGSRLLWPAGLVILLAVGSCAAGVGPDGPGSPAVVARGLDTPWGLAFLPDGSMLVTERKGTIRLIDAAGRLRAKPVATLAAVRESGEGGLLGIAVAPGFAADGLVYLYYSYSGPGGGTLNRVVRMTYANGGLAGEQIVLDGIPGAANHNGGRIKFGPDGFLYIGTGDAQAAALAQDTNSLAGKVLRIAADGSPAPGNPFGNAVYSYGHRNVQGLAWDPAGTMYATEHGRSGALSGFDEVNRIEAGKNYGWPVIEGDEVRPGMEPPLLHSGPSTTWAPSGAAVFDGSLFFAGLRGETLYQAVIAGGRVSRLIGHFAGRYGRLRDIVAGPDGRLYVSTSNRDGRGAPVADDDRILRFDPAAF